MSKERDKSYDSAIKQINKYYDDIDNAEKVAEEKRNISDLQQTESLYKGAVSRAGQNKLKEVQDSIKSAQAELMKTTRDNEKADALSDVESKYDDLIVILEA